MSIKPQNVVSLIYDLIFKHASRCDLGSEEHRESHIVGEESSCVANMKSLSSSRDNLYFILDDNSAFKISVEEIDISSIKDEIN